MSAKDKPLQRLSSNALSAKELARTLGLVKKRPSSSTSREKQDREGAVKCQPFAYLIVLDFESTCWKDKKMNYGPEIIEFPAVLLNTSSGKVESEFHMYVQPSENSRLSEFCIELTGITQAQADEGIPIGTCLMMFNRWLQELKDSKGLQFPGHQAVKIHQEDQAQNAINRCTFVTWSDWDLGTCLKSECCRKQLRIPHPMRSWIDLRATYKNFYSRKPQGLAGALQDLGIKFSGREHSGLDDARNTAHLAWRMICDGCVMQITKSLDGLLDNSWQIMGENRRRRQTSNTTATVTSNSCHELPLACKSKTYPSGTETKCHYDTISPTATAGNIYESLNFSKENKSGNSQGKEGNTTLKGKENEGVKYRYSCDMTKITQRIDPGQRHQENKAMIDHTRRDSLALTSLKRKASDTFTSLISTNVPMLDSSNLVTKKDMSGSSVKCLVAPLTSMSSSSKRSKGLYEEVKRKASTEFLPSKRGLVRQTLNTQGHSLRNDSCDRNEIRGSWKETYCTGQPCKPSNIGPHFDAASLPKLQVDSVANLHLKKLPPAVHNKKPLVEPARSCGTIQTASTLTASLVQKTFLSMLHTGQSKLRPPLSSLHTKVYSSLGRSPEACVSESAVAPAKQTTPIFQIGRTKPVTPLSSIHTKVCSRLTTPPGTCFNGGTVTPPLCLCGRRTRRRTVINPGPNQGRAFYTCSCKNRTARLGARTIENKSKTGCNFFRWEVYL